MLQLYACMCACYWKKQKYIQVYKAKNKELPTNIAATIILKSSWESGYSKDIPKEGPDR